MKTKYLSEVTNIKSGNSAPQGEEPFVNGKYNFYRTYDVGQIKQGEIFESRDKVNKETYSNLKIFPVNTILFPKSGASTFNNNRVIIKKEGAIASHLAGIKANPEFLNDYYLYYFLLTIDSRNLAQDSAYPSVNLKQISQVKIPVPSLQEQLKIVEKLDKVFETIDTKINQKITLNNQYKKYINSYIEKELFQEKNPVKLKDLINVNRKNINNFSSKFVGLENIVSNTSEVVNVESMAVKSNTYKFDKGSLLYGRLRPYLNKVTIVDFDGHCSTEIIPIDTTKELNIKYLKYFLMTQKTVNKINLQTTGARMPRASVSVLENLKIDLKSQKEQSKNVEIFDNITTLIQNIVKVNLKIIENSKLLKKSILNKEFSYE